VHLVIPHVPYPAQNHGLRKVRGRWA
jgi:hypothetical protein